MKGLLDWLLQYIYKWIEHFVEPIGGDQISLRQLLTGRIVLNDIQIKQKVLDFVPLPVQLQFNYVGRVSISLPLLSFLTNPIKVEVSDVILVVSTLGHAEWDLEDFKANFLTNKRSTLAANEGASFVNSLEDGCLWKVGLSVGKNVKVNIKNVHIRFEDWYSSNKLAFALGAQIGEVNVVGLTSEEESRNGEYKNVAHVAGSEVNIIRKKVSIEDLGVYCDQLKFPLDAAVPPNSEAADISAAKTPHIASYPSHRIHGLCVGGVERLQSEEHPESSIHPQVHTTETTEAKSGDEAKGGLFANVATWFKWGRKQEGQDPAKTPSGDAQRQPPDAPSPAASDAGSIKSKRRQKRIEAMADRGRSYPSMQTYSMDGRWPYRDLFASYCAVRLYDPRDDHWKDSEKVMEVLGKQARRDASRWGTIQNDRPDEAAREEAFLMDELMTTQQRELLRRYNEGLMNKAELPEELLEAARGEKKQQPGISAGGMKSHRERWGLPSRGDADVPKKCKALPLPALRVKPQCLPEVRNLMTQLRQAYHEFILAPRSLSLVLSLSLLPVVSRKQTRSVDTKNFVLSQMSRGLSTSGSRCLVDSSPKYETNSRLLPKRPEQRKDVKVEVNSLPATSVEDIFEESPNSDPESFILPMCRVDLELDNLRITVNATQTTAMLAWVDVYGNLYPTWCTAIQATVEKARPSFDEAEVYLDAWLIKMALMQGSLVPDERLEDPGTWPSSGLTVTQKEIVKWCYEFEMKYTSSAVNALRQEALMRWKRTSGLDHWSAEHVRRALAETLNRGKQCVPLLCNNAEQFVPRDPAPSPGDWSAALPLVGVRPVGPRESTDSHELKLNEIYALTISEFENELLGNACSKLKRFTFVTDVVVKLFMTDIQVFVCLGDQQADTKETVSLSPPVPSLSDKPALDLALLVEGVSVDLSIRSDSPSGLMDIGVNVYAVSMFTVSGFAGPMGPIPEASHASDEMSRMREEQFRTQREKLLHRLAEGRLASEDAVLKFVETDFDRRRKQRHGRRRFVDDQFQCHPLILIARCTQSARPQKVEARAPRKRDTVSNVLGLSTNLKTAQERPQTGRQRKNLFDRLLRVDSGSQTTLKKQLLDAASSITAEILMRPYRLPDQADLEIAAEIRSQIIILAMMPQLLSVLGGVIPILEGLAQTDLMTLYKVCSEVDVKKGRDFATDCAVGDLPHTSMNMTILTREEVRIVIPAPTEGIEHPFVEGLVLNVGKVAFLTRELNARKSIYDCLRLPAAQQRDRFEVSLETVSIVRMSNVFQAVVVDRHWAEQSYFLGRRRAVSYERIAAHYQDLLRKIRSASEKTRPRMTARGNSLAGRGSLGNAMAPMTTGVWVKPDLVAITAPSVLKETPHSFLLYPVALQPMLLELYHLPLRRLMPALHIDAVINRIVLEINSLDIVMFTALGNLVSVCLTPINGPLNLVLAQMANTTAKAAYIVDNVKPESDRIISLSNSVNRSFQVATPFKTRSAPKERGFLEFRRSSKSNITFSEARSAPAVTDDSTSEGLYSRDISEIIDEAGAGLLAQIEELGYGSSRDTKFPDDPQVPGSQISSIQEESSLSSESNAASSVVTSSAGPPSSRVSLQYGEIAAMAPNARTQLIRRLSSLEPRRSGVPQGSVSTSLGSATVDLSSRALSLELEAAIDRWARLSRHIDFGTPDLADDSVRTQPETSTSSVPSTESAVLWKVTSDAFTVVHARLLQLSMYVCAIDSCGEHQQSSPHVEYLRSSRSGENYKIFRNDRSMSGELKLVSVSLNNFGFNPQQSTYPLLGFHVNDLDAALAMSTNGAVDAQISISDLRLNEELSICPANMSSLYCCGELVESIGFGPTISHFLERKHQRGRAALAPAGLDSGFMDALLDDPVEELKLAGNHNHKSCATGIQVLNEQQALRPHILISISGDFTSMEKINAAVSITPIRLCIPLEFVDELLAFVTNLTTMLPVPPSLPPAPPIQIPPVFHPLIARSLGIAVVTKHIDLPGVRQLNPAERRIVQRLNLTFDISAIEVLVPIEPCRMPVKQQGKKAKFKESPHRRQVRHDKGATPASLKPDSLMLSPLASPINTPRIRIIGVDDPIDSPDRPPTPWSPDQQDQLKRVTEKWKRVAGVMRSASKPASLFSARLYSVGSNPLPMCVVLRTAVSAEVILYGYALSRIEPVLPVPAGVEPSLENLSGEDTDPSLPRPFPRVDSLGATPSASDLIAVRMGQDELEAGVIPSPDISSHDLNSTAPSRKLFRFQKAVDVYRWVESCVRAPAAPNAAIRTFCPGELDLSVNASSLTIAFVRPVCKTPVRFPRIHWAAETCIANQALAGQTSCSIRGGKNRDGIVRSPIVNPTDISIAINFALPSERTFWERYYGFSKQEAVEVRQLFGVSDPVDPEYLNVAVDVPLLSLDLDPISVTEVLKLLAVVGDFGAYQAERTQRAALFSEVATRTMALRHAENAGGDSSPRESSESLSKEPIRRQSFKSLDGKEKTERKSEPDAQKDMFDEDQSTLSDEIDNVGEMELVGADEPNKAGINELTFTEWLLNVGVPPTLTYGMCSYNVLNSFERMSLKVTVPLITVNLWSADAASDQTSQPRNRILSTMIQDFVLDFRIVAISSVGHPPPWWVSINPFEDILAGTDLIALSFVSYDFDPLIRNPYRARPQRRHGLYHVIRDLVRAAVKAYRSRKRKGAVPRVSGMDSSFRGSISDVRKKVKAALPWMVLEGQFTLSVDQATQLPPLAAVSVAESSLVEPARISFVGGKRVPETMMHLTTEVTWLNINVSVFVLDVLLTWARDIFGFKVPDAITSLSLQPYAKFRNRRLLKAKAADAPADKYKNRAVSPALFSIKSPSRGGDLASITGAGVSLDTLAVPSFVAQLRAIHQAKILLLGNPRCQREQICTEQTSQALLYIRPPGAWDILNALETALTGYMNILGPGFFQAARASRTAQIISHFPSALPSRQEETKMKKTISLVAETIFGIKDKGTPNNTRVLRIMNQLGQAIAIYLEEPVSPVVDSVSDESNRESTGWTIVPHGERFNVPVSLLDTDKLFLPNFALRFRLLNDVFDLRSNAELTPFVDAVSNAVQQELQARVAGKVEAPVPKSVFKTFQLTVAPLVNWAPRRRRSSSVSSRRIQERGRFLKGCFKLGENNSAMQSGHDKFADKDLRILRVYTKGLGCRKKVNMMCRLTPIPQITSIKYCEATSTKPPFVCNYAYELILSSTFTMRNLAQEELVVVHTTPALPKANEPANHPGEDVLYNLAMKHAADLDADEWIIEKDQSSHLEGWLSSKEATGIFYRLPPPPPPLEPFPQFSQNNGPLTLNPSYATLPPQDYSSSAHRRAGLGASMRRRRSGYRDAAYRDAGGRVSRPKRSHSNVFGSSRRESVINHNAVPILASSTQVRGAAALVDYLVTHDVLSVPRESAERHTRDRLNHFHRKYSDWPVHRMSMRELLASITAVDGISALILPGNSLDEDLELQTATGGEVSSSVPSLWPRTVPLHWLLSQQSEFHVMDSRTIKRVAVSCTTGRGRLGSELARPSESPKVNRTEVIHPYLRSSVGYVNERTDADLVSLLPEIQILDLQYFAVLEEKTTAIIVSSKTLSLGNAAISEFAEAAHDMPTLKRKIARVDLTPRVVTLNTNRNTDMTRASLLDASSESVLDPNQALSPVQQGGSRISMRTGAAETPDAMANHYAVTAIVITPDSAKAEGQATAVEFCVSPLFEMCNRLPRPLGVCNLTLEEVRAARRKARSALAQGLSPVQALSRDGRPSTLGPSPAHGSEHELTPLNKDISPSPMGASSKRRLTTVTGETGGAVYQVPAGENRLLPISEERIVFSFDHLTNPLGITLRVPQEVQKPDDIELIKQDRRRNRDRKRESDMLDQPSSIKDATASGLSHSEGGDASSVDASEAGDLDKDVSFERHVLHVDVTPANMLLFGASKTGASSHSDAVRIPCRTHMRTVTVFADTWVVNRLDYPLQLKGKVNINLMPHKRAVLSSNAQKDTLRFSFRKGHFSRVPGAKFYGVAPSDDPFQWRRIAGQSETVTSNSIKMGQYTSVAHYLNIPGSDITPPLSLVAWLSRSPFPFMRTNTLEVFPAYVMANDRPIPIYVRESPYKESFSGEATFSFGTFMTVPPGSRIEFHPSRPKKGGAIVVQISALPEVERFHHVIVAPTIAGKQNASSSDRNQDAPLWSSSVEIDNARVFQLRHPTSEKSQLTVGYFELTEVSVTVRNGVRIIRFLNPDVPDYRLVNVSSVPLAFAQNKYDGPFEVLKPVQKQSDPHPSSSGHGFQQMVSRNAMNPSLLTPVSVPFNFYQPTGPAILDIWIPSVVKSKQKVETGEKVAAKSKDPVYPANRYTGGGAKGVILKSRRKKLMQEDENDLDAPGAKFSIMKIVGSDKNRGDLRDLEATLQQMEDISDSVLKTWGHQKHGNSRLLHLAVQFEADKKRQISGRKKIDRLMLLPIPHRKEKFVPIRVKLRFFAGCKWVVFDNYAGNLAALNIDTSTPLPQHGFPGPGEPVAATPEQLRKELDKRRRVNELYLKAQHHPDQFAAELSALCKYDEVAVDELCRIWRFGSKEARNTVAVKFELITRQDFKTVCKERRQLQNEEKIVETPTQEEEETEAETKAQRNAVEQGEVDDAYEIEAQDETVADENVGTTRQHLEGDNFVIDPRAGEAPEINMNIGCDLRLAGVGCDIMDSKSCRDLVFISAAKICIAAEVIQAEEIRMLISIGWLQIDNALKEAYYPTVIRPIVDLHASRAASWFNLDESRANVKNLRSVILPGEEPPDVFVFNDASLFESDLLARFGAPENFEVLQIALENRLSPQPEQEDALSRYISYTSATYQEEMKKQSTKKKSSPKNQAVETEELRLVSPFQLYFKAKALPPPQIAQAQALLDIPLCAVQMAPLALNVDSPLINAAAMMADAALVLLSNFSLDFLTGDATTIQQSESSLYSEPWKMYLGPVDFLVSPQAALGKVSVAALDVGSIRLVVNITISGRGGSTAQSAAAEASTALNQQDRADSAEEEEPMFSRGGRRSEEMQVDSGRNGTQSNSLSQTQYGAIFNTEGTGITPLEVGHGMLVESARGTQLQTTNLLKGFIKANEDPALSPDGDLTAGAVYDPAAQAQTEQIRAALAALVVHASMSDAQIDLPSMHYRDLAGPSDELALEILTPYITKAAKQAAKVLGAIDLLGNPALMVRHCFGGFIRAGTEMRIGCFGSRYKYTQLHPGRAGQARWLQPFVACGFSIRSVLTGCASGALECISRLTGSWYNIMEQLARNADRYSIWSRDQVQLRRGGITEQPASLAEGCVAGWSSGLAILGMSLSNFGCKPVRGCRLGIQGYRAARAEDDNEGVFRRHSVNDDDPGAAYRPDDGSCLHVAKHISMGILSGFGSCLFGIPGAACACCGLMSSGALHNIIKIPMLQSVRVRRTFFRPGNNRDLVFLRQFDHVFAFWAAFASSPGAFGRFLGIGRIARMSGLLKNVILSIPLAMKDLVTETPMPGVMLIGTQRIALMTKTGLKWHLPWKKLSLLDFVCVEGGSYCFIRFIVSVRNDGIRSPEGSPMQSEYRAARADALEIRSAEKKYVFLLPCVGIEVGWAQYQLLLMALTPMMNE